MTTTAWSHLPNAKHIDAVIASIKSHPTEWGAARDMAWSEAQIAARDMARDTAWTAVWARIAAWDAARDSASIAAWGMAQLAVYDAIVALVAWDHAEKYLGMTPDELGVWYELSEDPACLLLIPYAYVQELVVT